MARQWFKIALVLLLWAGQAMAGETPANTGAASQPSGEDMEVIAVMEILQIMDLVDSMDMIKDVDVLIEVDQNENQD
ncbi:MAG: hypothetical protein P8X55_05080 [Desulfosarcinaceae bacterium]